MTERSIFWSTTGTGDGGAGGYSATDLFETFRSFFTSPAGTNYGGVAPDYLNKLAVTGTSSPLAVATGAGLVYGIPYFNSASVSVSIPTPASATRIDRIVLRASWSAQTVRITRIAGTEGAGTAPSMTQSAGVTWDVPLARVSITTGGVITVTDDRQWVGGVGDLGITTAKLSAAAVTTAKLADDAVTAAKIAADAVGSSEIAAGAVGTSELADDAVTNAKIADYAVGTSQLATFAVDTAQLADDAVNNNKLANVDEYTIKGRISTGTGNPQDLTMAQVLTLIKTVDGASSGLDADLLDGVQGSGYALASHSHGTADIADDAITNAKLANMATTTVKGRAAGAGAGDPTDLSAAQLLAIVATVDGAGSGLDADTLDGSHAAAFAAAAHTHDTATLSDDAVTNAKLANMATTTVKGRAAGAGTGDPTDLSAAQLLAIVATVDGAGSGLDADTLDGSQAADFAAAVHSHGTSGITDNAITNVKLADMNQATVKGRAVGAGSGDPTDLSAADLTGIVNSTGTFAAASHSHAEAWSNLTFNSTNFNSSITPQYRLNGDVVELRGTITNKVTGSLEIATLPSGYRPPNGNAFFRNGIVTSDEHHIVIATTGVMTVSIITGTYNISLDMIRFSKTA